MTFSRLQNSWPLAPAIQQSPVGIISDHLLCYITGLHEQFVPLISDTALATILPYILTKTTYLTRHFAFSLFFKQN